MRFRLHSFSFISRIIPNQSARKHKLLSGTLLLLGLTTIESCKPKEIRTCYKTSIEPDTTTIQNKDSIYMRIDCYEKVDTSSMRVPDDIKGQSVKN